MNRYVILTVAIFAALFGTFAEVMADDFSIREVGSLDIPMNYLGDVANSQWSFTFATSSNEGLHIVDVSRPDRPRLVRTVRGSCSGVEANPNGYHTYVGFSRAQEGLQVFYADTLVYSGEPANVRSLLLEDELLYVTVSTDSGNVLQIFNVSFPPEPSLVGQMEIGAVLGKPRLIFDGRLYLTGNDGDNSTIGIVDISNPEEPSLVDQFDHEGLVVGLVTDGEYLFIANQHQDQLQVRTLDWELVWQEYYYLPQGVEMYAGYLFLNSSGSGQDPTIRVFDISNAEQPELVNEFATGRQAIKLFFSRQHAYVVEDGIDEDHQSRLLIIYVEEPTDSRLYFSPANELRWVRGINEMIVSLEIDVSLTRTEFNLEPVPAPISEIICPVGRVICDALYEGQRGTFYDITYYADEREDIQQDQSRSLPPGTYDTLMIIRFDASNLEPGQRFLLEPSNAYLAFERGILDIPFESVEIEIEEEERGELQHWTDFHQSDESHSILVEEFNFNNQPSVSGMEIGAFTENGVLAGAGVWQDGERLGFPVWGDDPMTEEADGFADGEYIALRVWDPQSNEEYYTFSVVAREGRLNWQADGLVVISPMDVFTDRFGLDFHRGWNMVSYNVAPPHWYGDERGMNIPRILGNIEEILMVKDDRGCFYSRQNDFNNIPYWDITNGYQVYCSGEAQFNFVGSPVEAYADIPLSVGWNMIAYFPDYELPIGADDFYAVSPILDNVIMVKDGDGNFALPDRNFSSMSDMRPGQGYKIKVRHDGPFNYPAEPNQNDAVNSGEVLTNVYWIRPVSTGSNMSVMVSGLKLGSEVGAFNKDGKLVGSGVADSQGRCGLSICGDNEATKAIDGLKSGEEFQLRIWDGSKESFIPKTLKYEADGLEILEVDHKTLPFVKPVEFKLNGAYPNPFNASTLIAFDLTIVSQTRLSVFDLSGREVIRLLEGNLSAGSHSVHLNATDLPTGMYLVRLQAGEQTADLKVQLVK
ncbi:MAG: T9SS type A sorting domain-containing protein [bacterium]|nr:T9SS type A sorting domain-containing protein [bacterium]